MTHADPPARLPTDSWTLVTVAHNSARALSEFWGDWSADGPVEWIVVDNASTDDSARIAEDLGASVIRLHQNIGFGAANNLGFNASARPLVAFVNPDVRVVVEDLGVLADELARHSDWLVAPQLLNADGSLQPNGRGLPYLANKIANRLAPGRLNGTYLHYARPEDVLPVEWVMGAAVAGRREHLATLGPWDDRFFVYYEDSDLGLRNSRAGGVSAVIGTVRWTHGWARETTTASFAAWRRELPSMWKFYARYPALLGRPRNTSAVDR